MCGRFYVEREDLPEALLARMQEALLEKVQWGEVFPSKNVLALAPSRSGQARAFSFIWGLPRRDGKGLVINARYETAARLPLFRDSALRRRCVIPASAYFEWDQRFDPKPKLRFHQTDGGLIYLAGLYFMNATQQEPCMVILTRPASAAFAPIHPRMPQLLSEDELQSWLSPDLPLPPLPTALPDLVSETAS